MMTQSRSRVGVALALTLLVSAAIAPLTAQQSSPTQVQQVQATNAEPPVTPPTAFGDVPQTFGTGINVYTFPAAAMVPLSSTTVYSATFGSLYRTGGGLEFAAPVVLPTRAVITAISIDACDFSAGASITAHVVQHTLDGSVGSPEVNTGNIATPGCARFFTNFDIILRVENNDPDYFVKVTMNGGDATTRLGNVRVAWKRDVSPAPARATFSDVPVGNPYHQFIEALVASGITGGCGGGNYCPDAPVTRAQMAVFLSAALGLHWRF